MNTSLVLITPAIATEWLENYNDRNRPLKPSHVRAIAADIAAGRWVVNATPIQFDTRGRLIDGQHRLQAIVLAGVAVRILVARDIQEEAWEVIDQVVPRRPKDVLGHFGEKNVVTLAAVSRVVWGWTEMKKAGQDARLGPFLSGKKFTNGIAIEIVKTYPEVRDAVMFVDGNKNARKLFTSSIGGFMHWLLASIDRGAAEEFILSVTDGADLSKTDGRLALNRLNVRWAIDGRKISQEVRVACAIKAWNAWRSGQPIVVLSYRVGEKMPLPM
jgi:hypothetical protein